jgi:oligopeptide/dipeptide ABC transporter ATP-binding protein
MVKKVIVMYAGFIVESGPVRDLYKQTSHPYTLGLLRSIPAIDATNRQRLVSIKGLPPDLRKEPTHCPFAPRCAFVVEKCWQENPPLFPTGPDHYSACWRWEDVRQESVEGKLA